MASSSETTSKQLGSYFVNFVFTVAMATAFLYIGIANLDNCPVERMIPIYLIGKESEF